MPKKRAKTEGMQAHELMMWTRRLAAMVESGVSLLHCLSILAEEDTTTGMREVAVDLMERVEAGETLSQAMGQWSWVFSEQYVGLVIFGEVGGVLEVALRRIVERIEAGLLMADWIQNRSLTRDDLADWCWQFAHLLKAGVPPLHAVTTLSRTTHPVLRHISEEIAAEVEAGGSIAPDRDDTPPGELPAIWRYPGIFTPTVRQLIGMGVWFGPLDQLLLRAAELLDHEALLEREGKLHPLPTAGIETKQLPPVESEVMARVNDMIKAAIDKGAQWVTMEPREEGAGEATLTRGGDTLATLKLTGYEKVVRRVKIMADIDPFAQEERRSQIHLRYQGKGYLIMVHSRPGRLSLHFGEDERAVDL